MLNRCRGDMESMFACDAKIEIRFVFSGWLGCFYWNELFFTKEKDFQCLPKKCRRAGTCEGIVVRLEGSFRTEISV